MPDKKTYEMYEIRGQSLKAAKRLEKIVDAFYERVQNTPSLKGTPDKDIVSFLIAALDATVPKLLQATGLDRNDIQILTQRDAYPRAYEDRPQIYVTATRKPRYYMMAPVNYKGDHFVPQDADQLGEQEIFKAIDVIFAGGFLGNAPIVPHERHLCRLPDGFDPEQDVSTSDKHYALPACDDERTIAVFLADGRSLDVVHDFFRWQDECERLLEQDPDATITEPDLGKYWQLWNPKAKDSLTSAFAYAAATQDTKAPDLVTIGNSHFLVYTVGRNDDDPVHPPPDAIPVSASAFLYLLKEKCDHAENVEIDADSMPPEIIRELQNIGEIYIQREQERRTHQREISKMIASLNASPG